MEVLCRLCRFRKTDQLRKVFLSHLLFHRKYFSYIGSSKRIWSAVHSVTDAHHTGPEDYKHSRNIQNEGQSTRNGLDLNKLIFGHPLLHKFNCVGTPSVSEKRCFSTTNVKQNQEQKKDEGEDEEKRKEDFQNELRRAFFLMAVTAGILAVPWILGNRMEVDMDGSVTVSWNTFVYDMLAKGEVAGITIDTERELAFVHLHPGAIVKGRHSPKSTYILKLVEPLQLEDRIRKLEEELGIKMLDGVSIRYNRKNEAAEMFVSLIIAATILYILRRSISSFKMPEGMDMFSGIKKAKYVRGDQMATNVSFKDVAGLHEAKAEIMEFVTYLKNTDNIRSLGAKVPKGALLLGPPGCGKTLLARAVAAEAKVPFLAMAGSDFVEMIGGLGAARVRDLFKEAKEKKPCVIHLDEIDAIGRQRGGTDSMTGGEGEQTLNQLLVEMDGMDTSEGVVILASTNRPDILDKALLRSGRFDRHIQIDLPTLSERRETFEVYMKKLKLAEPMTDYIDRLAQLTPGMSGADIANICNEAALHAAREGKKAVDAEDFEYSIEKVVAGVAKKSRILSPQEKKMIAYHEAGHAIMSWLLDKSNKLLRVSIVPRTKTMMGFTQFMPSENKLYSKEDLFQTMCVALGGRVAESLTFNATTSSAQDDLKKVTDIAYTQIRQLGMSENVGLVSFPQESTEFGTKPYSKHLKALIDKEAKRMVASAYTETERILSENKEKLKTVAEALLEKETLLYDDLVHLVGPPVISKPQKKTKT